MNVVDHARLIWAARAEASRLHRLAVESARITADEHARLARDDARIYHCPGCGEWRYEGRTTTSHDPRGAARCAACGTHRDRGRTVAA